MGNRKTFIGIVAIVGVWVTAGVALPFVNRLTQFTPEQLLAARGLLTSAMAFILARGKVLRVDRYTLYIAIAMPLASLGLYKGIRAWGAGPTIIVITTTPVLNFAFTAMKGRKVQREAMISLSLILGGVIMARWGGRFDLYGLGWSLFGTVFNAILYELFAKARASPFQKCFWAMLGTAVVGILMSIHANWHQLEGRHTLQATLLIFAIVGGLLYWLANLFAFQYLPKDLASVLAQGETPAVIAASYILLPERLTPFQWIGVIVSLGGAWYLGQWLAKRQEANN